MLSQQCRWQSNIAPLVIKSLVSMTTVGRSVGEELLRADVGRSRNVARSRLQLHGAEVDFLAVTLV